MLKGWIALTGTPGTGKSSVADRLRLRAIPNVELGRFAHDYDLVESVDPVRTVAVVDPVRVAPVLASTVQRGETLLLDGHWSHDVPGVTSAIVLRLRPADLASRLKRRGWPAAKIRENAEAEAIDLILQEAIARLGSRRVFEVDTTGKPIDAVERAVFDLVRGTARAAQNYRPGRVDWSADVLAWY